MSKKHKERLIEMLVPVYGVAYLLIDDYYVAAMCEVEKRKLHVVVYVNGVINGKDLVMVVSEKPEDWPKEKDIARRFYCAKQHRAGRLIKQGRSYVKKTVNTGMWSSLPWFPNPKAFVNHIYKHNKNIQIITFEEYSAGKALKAAS